MSTKRWLLAAAALAALSLGGYCGYRALGKWLVASMAGRVQAATAPAVAAAPAAQDAAPATPQSQAVSGLDLIAKASPRAPVPGAKMSQAQLDAVRQAGIGLVDSLKPMLQNPAFTSRLSGPQAAQYKQLMSLLDASEKAVKSNQPLDLRQMAADVQKAQQLSLSLMSQIPQSAPGRTGQ